jgi:hypothetical protein
MGFLTVSNVYNTNKFSYFIWRNLQLFVQPKCKELYKAIIHAPLDFCKLYKLTFWVQFYINFFFHVTPGSLALQVGRINTLERRLFSSLINKSLANNKETTNLYMAISRWWLSSFFAFSMNMNPPPLVQSQQVLNSEYRQGNQNKAVLLNQEWFLSLRGHFTMSGDSLVITTVECHWHLVDRGQGCS